VTEQTIWSVLGIPEGSGRSEIRRAYARRVRAVNPEDDPEGFKALRDAYEIALYYADLPPFEEEAGEEVQEAPAAACAVVEPPLAPEATDAAPLLADDDEARLDELLNRFAALLNDDGGDHVEALQSLLEEILAAPALGGVGAQQRTERWIAFHIARTIPRSDLLIDRAVEAFGWDGGEIVRDGAVDAILRRAEEWRYIHWAKWVHSPVHQGWLALTQPPKARWEARLSALSAARANQVEQILRTAGNEMPGLYHQFAAEASEWWHSHLAKARPTIGVLALPVFIAALVAMAAALIDPRAWPALIPVGGLFAIASPWLYLRFVKQPQLEWQRWQRPAPKLWFSEGWMAALLLLPIAAAPLPPGPLGAAAALLLSALVAAWTAAALPSPYPLGDLGVRIPLLVKRLAFPLIAGLALVGGLREDQALAFLSVGAAITFAWWRCSEEMLYAFIRVRGRWGIFAATALAVAIAGALAAAEPLAARELRAWLAALAVVLVVPILVLAWRSEAEEKRFVLVLGFVALFFMWAGTLPPPQSQPVDTQREPWPYIPGAPPQSEAYVSPYCRQGTPIPETCIWPTPEEEAEEERLLAAAPTDADARLRLLALARSAAAEGEALRSGRALPSPVAPIAPPVPAESARPWPAPPRPVQTPPPARCPRDEGASGARAPVACDAAGSWFVESDYPEAALQQRVSGTTDARLQIGADGRVKSCAIDRSSGSAALDSATCRVLRQRARFLPARDSNGEAVAGVSIFSMSWTLRR
jgi:TonB family protein